MSLTATEQRHRELATDYVETVWNERDVDAVDEFLADDFAGYGFGSPEVDAEGCRRYLRGFHAGLPDLHVEINDTVCEGTVVALRLTAMGTHRGELFGIPATDEPVRVPTMKLCSFDGDRIETIWLVVDEGSLFRQLGVVDAAVGP